MPTNPIQFSKVSRPNLVDYLNQIPILEWWMIVSWSGADLQTELQKGIMFLKVIRLLAQNSLTILVSKLKIMIGGPMWHNFLWVTIHWAFDRS